MRANQSAHEGDLAFSRKDHYAALIKYLEASRLNPNSEYISNRLGIAYSQLKLYSEATAAFRRSSGLNSKYPYPYNNMGTVYFATNDKKKAEKGFKKAISLNDKVASFHVNLGTLYFEQKRFEKGMAELRKGLSIDPAVLSRSESITLAAASENVGNPEKSYFMARLFASMGNVERAVENLQLAVNAGFTNFEAIRSERDFDPIRQDERFLKFMKQVDILLKP
jgi:tetratricopeptide (TPR) repeat protein